MNLVFIKFIFKLIQRRPWHYAGGILTVIVLDAVDMAPALIIKHVTNEVQRAPQELDVAYFALLLSLSYLTIALLRLAWRFLLMLPSRTLERELRQEAYAKLLSSDFAAASRLKTGDVISTFSQDIPNIRMFMGPGILILFDSIAYLVFIPATLFYVLGASAAYVLLPFIALVVVISIVHKPIEKGHEELSNKLGDISQHVFEETQGVRFFRAENLLEVRKNKYQTLLKSLVGNQLNITKWELSLDATLQTVIQSSYMVVIFLAWRGHTESAQGLGALTVSLQLLDKLLWPLMSFSYLMNLYQQAKAGSQRLQLVSDLAPKMNGERDLESAMQEIQISKLSARGVDQKTILHEIDFNIRAGEHVALVGEVGSGKSTLLQVLAGMWEPQSLSFAQLSFNNITYHELNRKSLWNQLSYIPQSPQVFNRSLAVNVSPTKPLDEIELWESLEKADLAFDTQLFEKKLQTVVGEKGMNLSGGQKQRVLIARSFHSGAQLYLWDDAISALDSVTERKIISKLRQLSPNAMLILATHRLSSLIHFDKIVVLAKGQIVGMGRLDEIKQNHELFKILLENLKQDEPDKGDVWS